MSDKTFWRLFAFAALLRLAFIWLPDFWYDENFTLLITRLPLDHALRAVMGDVHPPLYYLLVWPLGQLDGIPAWALRLPSVLFSLAAFWLLWRIMYRLYIPVRVQVITLGLLAVLPFQLLYAQEARMYALLEAEVLLAVYAMLDRRWILLGVATAAMLYTQNYGLLYAPCIWLAGLIRHPHDWKRLTLSMTAAALTFVPWLGVLLSQMDTIGGNYWVFDATLGSTLHTLYQMFWGITLGGLDAAALPFIFATFVWIGAAVTWAALKLLDLYRHIHAAAVHGRVWKVYRVVAYEYIAVLLFAFGPLALAVIASWLWNPILLFRPLIGTSPFLVLLLAWPLGDIRSLRGKLAAAVFIVPILVVGLGGHYLYTDTMKSSKNQRSEALAYIVDNWQPGDVIYHSSDASIINWMPYSTGLAHAMKPDCGQRPYGALSLQTRRAFGMNIATLEEIPHRRAWVVWTWNSLIPQCEVLQMQDLTAGYPVYIIEDDDFTFSAVWLVENNHASK